MGAKVYHNSMGRKTVVTADKYGNERVYKSRPNKDGVGVVPEGEGRDYTPVVLKALWNESVVVDWTPDNLSAEERKQIDGFCNDCGSSLTQTQVGSQEWETNCPECGTVEVVGQ